MRELSRFIPAYAGNSDYHENETKEESVHPRLRGELRFTSSLTSSLDGSSPLTRGTLFLLLACLVIARFIPAYAGNSLTMRTGKQVSGGSSPLTRGTRKSQPASSPSIRFIPAYAGNSELKFRTAGSASVHPRLRGELQFRPYDVIGKSGSSPLTRGTQEPVYQFEPVFRFIPAYAGNSQTVSNPQGLIPVHPRLRGELRTH